MIAIATKVLVLLVTAILAVFRNVLGLLQVTAEGGVAVVEALARHGANMDFADALHAAAVHAADEFATFEIFLQKRAGTGSKVRRL